MSFLNDIKIGLDNTKEIYYKSPEYTNDNIFYELNDNNKLINNGNYLLKNKLGKGTFGSVYVALNNNNNKNVAIKIYNRNRFCKIYNQNEINVLNELNTFKKNEQKFFVLKNHMFIHNNFICVELELYYVNIYCYNFSLIDTFKITKQILQAIKILNKYNIIHSDIKPENILFNPKNNHIKLIDWGISIICDKSCEIYMPYEKGIIQTLQYKSPEIFSHQEFNNKIDIWSIGCIFFELHFGHCMFGGLNDSMIFGDIVNTIKIPNYLTKNNKLYTQYLNSSEKSNNSISFNKNIYNKLIERNKKIKYIECCNKKLYKYYMIYIDLLSSMLMFDPKKRITTENAINLIDLIL
jgi:serine/threonine-protein kinase PRP4